ncbi:hypothetical protein Lal_00044024 [Lupinus albus]|uniref:Putative transcription factor C2C2-GATA family n=1 Tax=Lupinus albus TaxID=3870 RepID=A0A6A5PDB1_LUPAL|nr:putative transcription factor C2C2-GATA family [Lupinus albus]KAF1895374.1 hypothetical protein Lal_00044024 [Lupinus albus]
MEGSNAQAQQPRIAEVERLNVEQPLKRCLECGTSSTPLWRRGEAGINTLCNACGLRFKSRSKASDPNKINNDVIKKGKRRTKIGNRVSLEKKLNGLANQFFSHRPVKERRWTRLTEEEQVAVLLMSLNA